MLHPHDWVQVPPSIFPVLKILYSPYQLHQTDSKVPFEEKARIWLLVLLPNPSLVRLRLRLRP